MGISTISRPFVSPIVASDPEDDNGDEWIGDTEVAFVVHLEDLPRG